MSLAHPAGPEAAAASGPRAPDHLPWRRGIARVLYSPAGRFRTVVFDAGQTKRFGRDERSDVKVADPSLRGAHFQVQFDGLRFHVEALAADAPLSIDGKPGRFGEVRSGGFVTAGATTFTLHLERATPAPDRDDAPFGPDRAALVGDVVRALSPAREAGTLYGVFDAARDPRVRVLLAEGVDEHASLYEGAEGAVLDEVSPYLVRFTSSSQLLERIVGEGWGRSWGIFAQSEMSPKDVRRHFRRFLLVIDEQNEERLYFRYYDPRVLREFFPIATPRQRAELLQGLAELSFESEGGQLTRLAPVAGS